MALQQLAEEALGSALVLAALHEDVQHVAVLIDGTPEILALAVDRHGNLIEKPTVTARSAPLSEAPRLVETKRGTPELSNFGGTWRLSYFIREFPAGFQSIASGNGQRDPHLAALPRIMDFLGHYPYEPAPQRGVRPRAIKRKLLDPSREELAAQIGIDPSTLGRVERNTVRISRPLHPQPRGRPEPSPHQPNTTRVLRGCTGRLLSKPMVERKASSCSLEASMGSFSTNQATPSEHGGVVNEPLK